MASISIFNGKFSGGKKLAGLLASKTGYRIVNDLEIIKKTCERYDIKESAMEKAVFGKASMFNSFTHEKERCIAYLKLMLAEFMEQDETIYYGYLGHLIPKTVTHVLKILTIGDMKYRISQAELQGISEKDAVKQIRNSDETAFIWTGHLFKTEPWDSSLYDIVIPCDKMNREEAAELVIENLEKDALQYDETSRKHNADFRLAANVEVILAHKGHNVGVESDDGNITLIIDKKVTLLSMLEKELKQIVSGIPDIKSVETKIGQNFYQADIYHKYNFDINYKVLLVDDEREFAQTLSERLSMREVPNVAVYSGEDALGFISSEHPEVVVLDLKMPGIDGYEVLRRVKQSAPHIEVIILTGHGSENDRKRCMEMGAFAYLQKPMDIDLLTQTMKEAYELIDSRTKTPAHA